MILGPLNFPLNDKTMKARKLSKYHEYIQCRNKIPSWKVFENNTCASHWLFEGKKYIKFPKVSNTTKVKHNFTTVAQLMVATPRKNARILIKIAQLWKIVHTSSNQYTKLLNLLLHIFMYWIYLIAWKLINNHQNCCSYPYSCLLRCSSNFFRLSSYKELKNVIPQWKSPNEIAWNRGQIAPTFIIKMAIIS